jgi:hypothetical protein
VIPRFSVEVTSIGVFLQDPSKAQALSNRKKVRFTALS